MIVSVEYEFPNDGFVVNICDDLFAEFVLKTKAGEFEILFGIGVFPIVPKFKLPRIVVPA